MSKFWKDIENLRLFENGISNIYKVLLLTKVNLEMAPRKQYKRAANNSC